MDVIVTTDGGYAIAGSNNHAPGYSNAMVIKTNHSGNVQWAKSFDSQNTDQATNIAEDDGGLIVGGMQYGQSSSLYDAVLMKLNMSDGSVIWSNSYDADSKMNWFLC